MYDLSEDANDPRPCLNCGHLPRLYLAAEGKGFVAQCTGCGYYSEGALLTETGAKVRWHRDNDYRDLHGVSLFWARIEQLGVVDYRHQLHQQQGAY